MALPLIKKLIRRAFAALGLDLRRRRGPFVPRATMDEALRHAQTLGFSPGTVIDIGVNTGTPGLYAFDKASYILIDPLLENEVFMRHICSRLASATYQVCAAGATDGEVVIHVSPDFGGSSIFQKVGAERRVPVRTLDAIARDAACRAPVLIKIDTQGAELEILRGATRLLSETEMVILEVSLHPNSGMPDFAHVVAFLRAADFVLFDLFDHQYRPRDGVLGAVDAAFVRATSPLCASTSFRTPEQVQANVRRKLAYRRRALRAIGKPST